MVLRCGKAGGNGEGGKSRQILFKLPRVGQTELMLTAARGLSRRLECHQDSGDRMELLCWKPCRGCLAQGRLADQQEREHCAWLGSHWRGFKKVLLPRDNKQLVTYPCSRPYNQFKIIKLNHVNGRRTSLFSKPVERSLFKSLTPTALFLSIRS